MSDRESESAAGGSPLPERETRSLYRHWLAALGGALMLAGLLAFIILFLIDATSDVDNPYRSIIGFIGAPIIGIIGLILFLIAVRIQIVRAKKSRRTGAVPAQHRTLRSSLYEEPVVVPRAHCRLCGGLRLRRFPGV